MVTLENRIRNKKTEYVYGVDDYGKVVFENAGDKDEVKLSGIPENLRAVTHNHPNSSSYSEADLHSAIALGFKEIRICSKYVDYTLKPSASGKWYSSRGVSKETAANNIEEEASKVWAKLKDKYEDLQVKLAVRICEEWMEANAKPISKRKIKSITDRAGEYYNVIRSDEYIRIMAKRHRWQYEQHIRKDLKGLLK